MIRTRIVNEPRLTAARVAEITGGRLMRPGRQAKRVTTDSRAVQAGDLFVALRGDQHDGHDHAAAAVAQGACGAVLEHPVEGVPESAFVVLVKDARKALSALAAEHRRASTAKVVGITGSCGKTTTKDMLGQVLASAMPTVWSPKSFNNDVGVPLTLFGIQANTKAAVVEMGTNGPGEIEALARIAQPDIAIVTCVAESHLQGLGSVEGVAKEKAALISSLRQGGLAILNGDDPNVAAMARATIAKKVFVRLDRDAEWFATDVRFCGLGTTFKLRGEVPVTLPRLGSHNVYNALFTLAAAHELGMSTEAAIAALSRIPPSQRRLEHKVVADVTLIDDTYNMNPGSARAALQAIAGLATSHPRGKGRKIVVLGEMLELGAQSAELHRSLGSDVVTAGIDVLVVVGAGAQAIANGALDAGMQKARVVAAADVTEAQHLLAELVRPGDQVLCKASRRVGLDRLVDGLAQLLVQRGAEAPAKRSRPQGQDAGQAGGDG